MDCWEHGEKGIEDAIKVWGVEALNKGYGIFDFDGTGMLQIERIGVVGIFKSDAEAVQKAIEDGINIIPVDELPKNFQRRYLGWIDTPQNRERIKKYCERKYGTCSNKEDDYQGGSYNMTCSCFKEDKNLSKKAKAKIEELSAIYGDIVQEAVHNDAKVVDNAMAVIADSKDEQEIDSAYTDMVMAYYIDFQRKVGWTSTLTFESYWAMLNYANSRIFEDRAGVYDARYGRIRGLQRNTTRAFENTIDNEKVKIFEDHLFIARTDRFGWVIYKKAGQQTMGVNYQALPKNSSQDFVMGYCKCLSYQEGWM